jgi:hypothetical protein
MFSDEFWPVRGSRRAINEAGTLEVSQGRRLVATTAPLADGGDFEAGNEPVLGKAAVAHVQLGRLNDRKRSGGLDNGAMALRHAMHQAEVLALREVAFSA